MFWLSKCFCWQIYPNAFALKVEIIYILEFLEGNLLVFSIYNYEW